MNSFVSISTKKKWTGKGSLKTSAWFLAKFDLERSRREKHLGDNCWSVVYREINFFAAVFGDLLLTFFKPNWNVFFQSVRRLPFTSAVFSWGWQMAGSNFTRFQLRPRFFGARTPSNGKPVWRCRAAGRVAFPFGRSHYRGWEEK